jgi:hypothetical protein
MREAFCVFVALIHTLFVLTCAIEETDSADLVPEFSHIAPRSPRRARRGTAAAKGRGWHMRNRWRGAWGRGPCEGVGTTDTQHRDDDGAAGRDGRADMYMTTAVQGAQGGSQRAPAKRTAEI